MAKILRPTQPTTSADPAASDPGLNPVQGIEEENAALERLKVLSQLNPHGPFGDEILLHPPNIERPHVIVVRTQEDQARLQQMQIETLILQAETARMKAETEHLRAQLELEKAKSELKLAQAQAQSEGSKPARKTRG